MTTVGPISSLLPELPGVRPLTRNEIKRDINLIESYYDSDSDCSVSSSEAISSSYPVKPRNYPKLPKRDEMLLQAKVVPHSHIDIGAGMSMDDSAEFMKAVEMARPDVFEAEKQREELEIRYQAMREMSISHSEAFLTTKREQKNFIRAMQGFCRNHCQHFDVLSQKNSMLYDMIKSLQHKKQGLNFFGKSLAELEQHDEEDEADTSEAPSDDKSGVFHFYKNQCVSTPMGLGSIMSIDASEEKVSIKLPFGIMYSSFASVISWCSVSSKSVSSLDVNHVENLRQKWIQSFAKPCANVGMSEKLSAEVEQLLYDDKHPTPELVQEAEPQVEGKSKRKANVSKSRRSGGRIKEQVVPEPTPMVIEDSASVTPELGNSNMLKFEDSKRKVYVNHTKKLPLLFCPPGIVPYLVSAYGGNYVTENALAQSKTSTSESEDASTQKDDVNAQNYLQAEYCLKAFQRKAPVHFFCNMGGEEDDDEDDLILDDEEGSTYQQLNCRFDEYTKHIAELKDNLHPLLTKIKECRKRKRILAKQVEHSKLKTAEVSQQISKIRLGMFTRRVLYRQNVVAMTEQAKSCKESSSNGEPCSSNSSETSIVNQASVEESSLATDKGKVSKDTSSENSVDDSQESQSNPRRKSTRACAAVVPTNTSSESQSSSRSKRKKDEVSKDEEVSVEPVSTSSTASTANSNTKAASLKRNPKRLRR